MKLEGRRESTNVEDRRGRVVKGSALGLGGLIVAALITWMMGGNPLSVINNNSLNQVTNQQTTSDYTPTAEEEEFVTLSKKILAGTEDVWTAEFKKMGLTYTPPKLVLFSESTTSGCGSAQSSTGPFYCSADQCVYLDVSFFKEMKQKYGGGGDFAYAYVIAHEVGHHVQYLLGTLDKEHAEMAKVSKTEANKISVRIELQADYYAGIWAHQDNAMFGSMEDGDIEKGIATATAIGDDRLEKKAQGYVVPDSFTHGTSAQRVKWFTKGIKSGHVDDGDTFSCNYDDL